MDVNAVGKEAELPKFTGKQLLSLAALAGLAVGVLFFSWNVGLMGFLMGSLLIIFGCGDEKKAVQMVPWNVIIMGFREEYFYECYLRPAVSISW